MSWYIRVYFLGMLDPVEYARELKRQVEEREKEKNKKKEEQEKYDRKKEEECANYNPWGRGGAGAPLKDAQVSIFLTFFHITTLFDHYSRLHVREGNRWLGRS